MTREHKLALIVGFALFLVVGVLVSDHFSSARKSQPGSGISALGPREAGASSIQPPVTGTMSSQEIVMGGSGIGDRYQSMPPTSPQPAVADPGAPWQGTIVSVPTGTSTGAPEYQIGQTPQMPAQQASVVSPGASPGYYPNPALPGNGAAAAVETGRLTTPGASLETHFEPVGGTGLTPPAPVAVQPPVQERPQGPSLPVTSGKVQKRSVQEGETIYAIAQEIYGDGNMWSKLRDFNKGKIGANGSVREGVTLTFPPKDVLLGKAILPEQARPGATTTPPVPGATPAPGQGRPAIAENPAPARPAGKTYTMQRGDVLSVVAQKTLGSARRWHELVEANKDVIDDPDNIPAGTVLKIPSQAAAR